LFILYPLRRKTSLTIAFPASTTADVPHLREKTFKLGFIGRTLAIFRVEKVLIYQDKPQNQDFKVIKKILDYISTPQYLRKSVFKLTPELRYAGILPPLRTPDHPLKKYIKDLVEGEIRKGFVVKSLGEYSLVDVGVEKPIVVEANLKPKTQINLKIVKVDGKVKGEIVSWDSIPYYWGFKVEVVRQSLGWIVKHKNFDLKIATSKYGQPIENVAGKLVEAWSNSKNVLVVFGSPSEGVKEILGREGLKPTDVFDFVLNTIKNQGTETVRVEEALNSTLAILNFLVEE